MNQSLKENPDVIRLFDTMEQSRLYVEKSQLQRVVDKIDELTFTVSQLQEEIATLRQQAEMNETAPLFDEAEASVTQAKGIIERTKERVVDTAKRAVTACRDGGRNALISTLHAAHISRLLSRLQQTLQDTERRLQGSVAKTDAVSAEWNMAKAHLRNAGRVMNGGTPQADVSAKPVKVALQKIMDMTAGSTLWVNEYSAPLLSEFAVPQLCVDADFLSKAGIGEFCLVENVDVMPYLPFIEKVILFHWNRAYPSDVRFPINLRSGKWTLQSAEDFVGSSHNPITMEVFTK